MMKTRYLTFILRLRLDEPLSQDSARDRVAGSVQQVGRQEIFYFDSAEKFKETLQRLVVGVNLKELKNGKFD